MAHFASESRVTSVHLSRRPSAYDFCTMEPLNRCSTQSGVHTERAMKRSISAPANSEIRIGKIRYLGHMCAICSFNPCVVSERNGKLHQSARAEECKEKAVGNRNRLAVAGANTCLQVRLLLPVGYFHKREDDYRSSTCGPTRSAADDCSLGHLTSPGLNSKTKVSTPSYLSRSLSKGRDDMLLMLRLSTDGGGGARADFWCCWLIFTANLAHSEVC